VIEGGFVSAAPGCEISGLGDCQWAWARSMIRRPGSLAAARGAVEPTLNMIPNPPFLDPRSRLALACSALARAGQQLSTASTSDQARAALRQVAAQLEEDRNLANLIAVEEIARKCRETAGSPDDAPLLPACRQLATTLARRASSLAAEVQQRSAAAVAPTPAPAIAAATVTEPAPAPAAVPRTPTPQPAFDPGLLRRVTMARSPAEQGAVSAALRAGQRFAPVEGATLIDVQTNRMWALNLLPPMNHGSAREMVRNFDAGDYHDWRLPTAEELQTLLNDGGLTELQVLGVLPGASPLLLWSSQVTAQWFGLLKRVGVASCATGLIDRLSPKTGDVHTLAVRG
jgi:hypothetical protein